MGELSKMNTKLKKVLSTCLKFRTPKNESSYEEFPWKHNMEISMCVLCAQD